MPLRPVGMQVMHPLPSVPRPPMPQETSPQHDEIVVTGQRQTDEIDFGDIVITGSRLLLASNSSDPRLKGPWPKKPIPNDQLKTSKGNPGEEEKRLKARQDAEKQQKRYQRKKGKIGLLLDILEALFGSGT